MTIDADWTEVSRGQVQALAIHKKAACLVPVLATGVRLWRTPLRVSPDMYVSLRQYLLRVWMATSTSSLWMQCPSTQIGSLSLKALAQHSCSMSVRKSINACHRHYHVSSVGQGRIFIASQFATEFFMRPRSSPWCTHWSTLRQKLACQVCCQVPCSWTAVVR